MDHIEAVEPKNQANLPIIHRSAHKNAFPVPTHIFDAMKGCEIMNNKHSD